MELSVMNLKLICKGAQSFIYKFGQMGNTVVLKMVICNKKQSKHLLNEYNILKKLHHQYIINILKFQKNVSIQNFVSGINAVSSQKTESLISNQNSAFFDILVMQHAKVGTLRNVLYQKKLTVPQLRCLFHQICEAVEYLHCNYIVHRDLKLQNILVTIENSKLICKIADFGFASSCINEQNLVLFNSYKGTKRGYMAPQIHESLSNSQNFYDARKSDVFALGVILFALFLGTLPFQYAKKQNNIYRFIAEGDINCFWQHHQAALNKFEMKDCSMVQDFKKLFISMVRYDANQRVNLEDVLDSDWMNGLKQETLV